MSKGLGFFKSIEAVAAVWIVLFPALVSANATLLK